MSIISSPVNVVFSLIVKTTLVVELAFTYEMAHDKTIAPTGTAPVPLITVTLSPYLGNPPKLKLSILISSLAVPVADTILFFELLDK